MAKTILVVEDEADVLELIRYHLAKEGYEVLTAGSGEKGLETALSAAPDLVVLDVMLPVTNGLDICRQIKANPKTAHMPIIMLTAKSEEVDVVLGLELGADDYLAKPFSFKVLIARIRAIFRRSETGQPMPQSLRRFGSLCIDPGRVSVTVDNQRIELTASEFKVLQFLSEKPGWVFSRYQIVEAVRGEDHVVTDRTVDVLMVKLRKKLGSAADWIETIRGVGYRFKEEKS
ncbi:MAG: response regulator transcription factor [Candidatus Margulisiibacteriota bacterium]